MLKQNFSIVLMLFITIQAMSQTEPCLLSGCLIDQSTGAALAEVRIQSLDNAYTPTERMNYISFTDKNGYFQFQQEIDRNILILDLEGYNDTVAVPANHCNQFHLFYAKPLTNKIQEVVVQGFQNSTIREKIPAAIGYIDRKVLDATDQTSFQNALNTIPGVIMESRGYGGSHRLSIRGSALRSPFAVRNVKMYLEGIPLTSPDGQAPLEMLDPADIASLEIIKGPMGSVWGSGNGGALLFKSRKALAGKSNMGFSTQIGSYGAVRTNRFMEVGLKNGGLRISQVKQDNDGYRQLEYNHKNQISVSLHQYLNDKNKLFVYGTYYKGNWGLPGALTWQQAQEHPTQAVKFSLANNAELERERLMAGISHTHKINSNFSETTSFYVYSTKKLNPYGTSSFNSGYKDEGADGFGGRTDWSYQNRINSSFSYKLNVGGEWQTEKYNILENKISAGQPGDFKYLYDIGYVNTMGFLSGDLMFKNWLTLNVGASINHTSQAVKGFAANGFAFDTTATWSSEILPRIALSARIIDELYAFGSLSFGNSNPTVFEMVDYENNGYNLSLKPEHGLNKEIGVKQLIQKLNMQFEVSVYEFELTNAILGYVDTTTNGDDRTRYRNNGNTKQQGLEWSVSKKFAFKNSDTYVLLSNAGSAYHYQFAEYVLSDVNLSGKKLPGVPLFNISNNLSLHILKGLDLTILHYWFDKTPLDNSNLIWSNAYHLINLRIGYSRTFEEQLTIGIYGGINNVMDAKYSSFYALNASGGRYYNPSPPANYFGGITISWKL